jgi:hypothetical protein
MLLRKDVYVKRIIQHKGTHRMQAKTKQKQQNAKRTSVDSVCYLSAYDRFENVPY